MVGEVVTNPFVMDPPSQLHTRLGVMSMCYPAD